MAGTVSIGMTMAVEQTISPLIRELKDTVGHQALLIADDETLTYAEAEERSAAFAVKLLASGIGKGSRVAMLFPNTPDFIVVWLAIARIGACAVPISTLSTRWEMGRTLKHCGAQLIVATTKFLNHDYARALNDLLGLSGGKAPLYHPDFPFLRDVWILDGEVPGWQPAYPGAEDVSRVARLRAGVESSVTAADPITIIYTSGTTSEPKGVIHTQGTFLRQSRKMAKSYPYKPGDCLFTVMPFFWVGGLMTGILTAMQSRATLLCSSAKGRQLIDFIVKTRPSYVLMWPNLAKNLADDPAFYEHDFSFIKSAGVSDAIFPHLRDQEKVVIGNSLGMTETAGPHTQILDYIPAEIPHSMGPTGQGMEHKLVDPQSGEEIIDGAGELYVRGDCLMLSYVGKERAECFTTDGWFATGDLCEFREGHIIFHGRCDDMIKSHGANVSPAEVEAVLLSHPDVELAIATGVPDPIRDQVIGAGVVLGRDSRITESELIEYVASRLSSYKVPRLLVFLEAGQIEMTASGKIKRNAIIKMLSTSSEQDRTHGARSA